MLAEIQKWFRWFDPLGWDLPHAPGAPKGFRPLPEQTESSTFPGRAFFEIRAYELGSGATYGLSAECYGLANDGRLCPDVVYPGKKLNKPQTRQLVSIARRATEWHEEKAQQKGQAERVGRIRMHCGDNMAAMFVFYDAGHRPAGLVEVDEGCVQWALVPAPKQAWFGFAVPTEPESEILRRLCVELDFERCKAENAWRRYEDERGHPRLPTREEKDAESRALLPLVLAEWPGIDPFVGKVQP